jgi:hypothetical protein
VAFGASGGGLWLAGTTTVTELELEPEADPDVDPEGSEDLGLLISP